MNSADNISIEFCSHSDDIAQFLDGELTAADELLFEKHLANCPICARKLNEQKRLLLTLNHAFAGEKHFELPADFFKTVVARSESNVSGLRRRDERAGAFVIVCGLFLTGCVIGFAGGRSGFLSGSWGAVWSQIRVVAAVLSSFCYDLGLAIVIALRVGGNYLIGHSTFSHVFFAVLLLLSLIALSGLLFNYYRTETQK